MKKYSCPDIKILFKIYPGEKIEPKNVMVNISKSSIVFWL
jgi:hypothetical protein